MHIYTLFLDFYEFIAKFPKKRGAKMSKKWAKTGKNIIEGVTIIDMRAVLK